MLLRRGLKKQEVDTEVKEEAPPAAPAVTQTAAPTQVVSPPPKPPEPAPDQPTFTDKEREILKKLRRKVHDRVIADMDRLGVTLDGQMSEEKTRQLAADAISDITQDEGIPISAQLREELIRDIIDEVHGYGPIQRLLDDPTISEVMVNSPKEIFFERNGKLYKSDRTFDDDDHVLRIIDKIVSPLGRQINEKVPMVDARLPDGSRVNAVVKPIGVKGPNITIRKFSKKRLTIEDLISFGSLTEEMAMFLKAAVEARLNIVVSGGTGSGKTTLLNVLSNFIPHDERVITIEDAAELQLYHDNLVSLEARPPNLEGVGEITIRDLVRNALRMRPDRIVVGECRSGEALDMLQAMNTGHDGSLTTLHSNSPKDTISRLETMVMMAGMDLPLEAIAKQIASAIDLIVHIERMSDGSRKTTNITEVQGLEGATVLLQDIFIFEKKGIDDEGKVIGQHKALGFRPMCMEKILTAGIKLPDEIFFPKQVWR